MVGFVAVHTGAGNSIDKTKYEGSIKDACQRATDILRNGGTAMDACEGAIIRLENCGNTNAGFGSNLCWDGTVECDAAIMNGSNLQFGACTNVSRVKNPIQLARCICDGQTTALSMQRIPPMILASGGAEKFASNMGCTMVSPEAMISSKANFYYKYYKSRHDAMTAKKVNQPIVEFENEVEAAPSLDTVGAVCVDENGNTAAGCSSGGILLKMPGRVGQAATYGAGCWAINTKDVAVATCTTGNGEYLMKTLLAKEICNDALSNDCAVTSLHKTFNQKFLQSKYLKEQEELYAGALTLIYHPTNHFGEVLWSHTTQSFCVGYMATTQKSPKFVCSPLPTYCKSGKSCVVNGHNFHLRI